MKILKCKTITEFSPREFSDKTTKLMMKMRREGYHVQKIKVDTCALKEYGGINEIIGYTMFFIFESDSDSED